MVVLMALGLLLLLFIFCKARWQMLLMLLLLLLLFLLSSLVVCLLVVVGVFFFCLLLDADSSILCELDTYIHTYVHRHSIKKLQAKIYCDARAEDVEEETES